MLWVALNLLQFTVSNQSVPKSVNEDRINKPFRAIPSGKISVYHATILRWVLVPVCIGHSMLYSLLVTFTSAFLIILTILYNEFDISSNGPLRNVFNALGYACFGSGAILVASPDPSKLSNVALKAITLNLFFVLLTTIHAQDFQDVDGDKEVGRITLPMMMPPSIARSTLLILLVTWSFILSKVWAVSAVVLLGYLGLATLAGLNYVLYETVEDDHCSYRIYNVSPLLSITRLYIQVDSRYVSLQVWLAFTRMLPAMSRFKDTS